MHLSLSTRSLKWLPGYHPPSISTSAPRCCSGPACFKCLTFPRCPTPYSPETTTTRLPAVMDIVSSVDCCRYLLLPPMNYVACDLLTLLMLPNATSAGQSKQSLAPASRVTRSKQSQGHSVIRTSRVAPHHLGPNASVLLLIGFIAIAAMGLFCGLRSKHESNQNSNS